MILQLTGFTGQLPGVTVYNCMSVKQNVAENHLIKTSFKKAKNVLSSLYEVKLKTAFL